MWASTRCWRGVSPVASGGPSGSSVTLRVVFFVAMLLPPGVQRSPRASRGTVRPRPPGFKHLFERACRAVSDVWRGR